MKRSTRAFILILIGHALLLLMTKLFFLDIMVVRGRSMTPSLEEGTLIVINKMAYGLREPFTGAYLLRWRKAARGEIVVFKSPRDETSTVKRCVAVGGDAFTVAGDTLSVNELTLPLKFFEADGLRRFPSVPEGFIFAIGDNTAASTDSRSFGFVSEDSLIGAMPFAPLPPRIVR